MALKSEIGKAYKRQCPIRKSELTNKNSAEDCNTLIKLLVKLDIGMATIFEIVHTLKKSLEKHATKI